MSEFNSGRLELLIKVVKRARDSGLNFDMNTWQSIINEDGKILDTDDIKVVKTEKKAHECGTVCCVAGLLALSPEFKRVGGKVESDSGRPILDGYAGGGAITVFLQATTNIGNDIAGVGSYGFILSQHSNFYKSSLSDLTLDIVIERLEKLLATGE